MTEKLTIAELKRKPRKGSKARARIVELITMLEDQHREWNAQIGLYQKTSKRDFASWINAVFKQAHKIFVAQWKDKRIEGICFLSSSEYSNSAWITDLILSPEFRNHGYGTKLLKAAFASCKRERKVPSISVSCQNTLAMQLYKKLGFKPLHMSMVKLSRASSISSSEHCASIESPSNLI